MIRRIARIVWVFLALTAARADTTNLTVRGVAEFGAAYQAWDGDGFARAAATFAQASAEEPSSVTNLYWKGVAEFHRVLHYQGLPAHATNRQQSAVFLERTVQSLQEAIRLDPQHAESHALLSTVYGVSIGAKPSRALWLGPRLMQHEKLARKLSPDNPRVLYLAGMSRFYGPPMLGGKEEALKLLLAAEKEFATEARRPAAPAEPRWGRVSNLVYAGKTQAVLGAAAEARKCYRQALELDPQDRLARAELEKLKP